jgi:cellobiose-specific phosphotransferase system component IIC
MGTLLASTGFLVWSGGTNQAWIITAIRLLAFALYTRTTFLAILAAIAIGPCLNSSVDYKHAMYVVMVQRPLWTIGVYGGAAGAACRESVHLRPRGWQ